MKNRHLVTTALLAISLWLPTTGLSGNPPTTPETPTTTPNELRVALIRGELQSVERRARVRIDELEADVSSDPAELASWLDVLVEALYRRGKSADPQVRAMADRAWKLKRKALASDDPELGHSLDNLARLAIRRSAPEDARAFYEQALVIRRNALGAGHPAVGGNLTQLGWVLYVLGEFELADAAYEEAVSILHGAHEEWLLGFAFNNRAILWRALGDYSGARELYERSIEILERVLGAENPSVASIVHNLAIVLKNQGDYARALSLYERSIRLGTAVWGEKHPFLARFYNNFAEFYRTMGDYESAQRLFEQSLEIAEATGGPDSPEAAAVLNNLGNVLTDTGHPERAREYLERALKIRERAFGPESRQVARVLKTMAYANLRAGEFERAEPQFQRALVIFEAVFGEVHHEVADVLEDLGKLYRQTGKQDKAQANFERAREIYETVFGPHHPRLAGCLRLLAAVELDRGDTQAALEHALRADEIGREHLQLTARVLPERQALVYALARPAGQDLALSVLAGKKQLRPDDVASTWNALIRSRALVLDEMRVRRQAMAQAEEPALRLARSAERLANLLVRGPGRDPERYRQLLLDARRERDRAETDLARASAGFRRTKQATEFGFADVSARATGEVGPPGLRSLRSPRGPALLHGLDRRRRTAGPPRSRWGTRRRSMRSWSAGARRSRPPAVARRCWRGPPRRAIARPARRCVAPSGTPIAEALDDHDRIFVVPDGALHLVNLATLPSGDGAYLVESAPPLHHLSTERDLVRLADSPASGEGLFVTGGADFGPDDPSPPVPDGQTCENFDALRFAPLPGTLREVDTVASLWQELRPRGSGAPARGRRSLGGCVQETRRRTPDRAPGDPRVLRRRNVAPRLPPARAPRARSALWRRRSRTRRRCSPVWRWPGPTGAGPPAPTRTTGS